MATRDTTVYRDTTNNAGVAGNVFQGAADNIAPRVTVSVKNLRAPNAVAVILWDEPGQGGRNDGARTCKVSAEWPCLNLQPDRTAAMKDERMNRACKRDGGKPGHA
jgi:hypothetical protein